jgi:hypothetical protein
MAVLEEQSLTSIAWSFAKLEIEHGPLFAAMSAAALPQLAAFSPFGLSDLAGAIAMIYLKDAGAVEATVAATIFAVHGFELEQPTRLAQSFARFVSVNRLLVDPSKALMPRGTSELEQ